ncbi:MAG: hypothetical protein FJX56_06790, partial [Alphaproteobacteria bacterium]|nr:hypothetical protein [Alphaproteobacteria bacterium]
MSDWGALQQELDAWASASRAATLWWRDDDVTAPSLSLDRLLALAERFAVPVALATVPEQAEPALARRVADHPLVHVFVHGFAHSNHAPPGARPSEFGAERDLKAMRAELLAAHERVAKLFSHTALPVFVPPWNRMAEAARALLSEAAFRGLSALGPRPAPRPGLVEVNVHANLVDSRAGGRFRGTAVALGAVIAHLRARRTGSADAGEATGLLTHHLVQDGETWSFIS